MRSVRPVERMGLRHRGRRRHRGRGHEDQADETPADDGDGDGVYVLQDDPDAVDTAPTRIESEAEEAVVVDEPVSAADVDPSAAGRSRRGARGLPAQGRHQVGPHWAPDSALYESARAELWLASEEFARTNGFERADESRP